MPMGHGLHPAFRENKRKAIAVKDSSTPVGHAQKDYNTDRPGDEWFSFEESAMDLRGSGEGATKDEAAQSQRGRKMQLKEESDTARQGVAGNKN